LAFVDVDLRWSFNDVQRDGQLAIDCAFGRETSVRSDVRATGSILEKKWRAIDGRD
jgi:hypothetical protein